MSSYPATAGVPEFNEYVLKAAQGRMPEGHESILHESDIVPTCGAADAIGSFRLCVGGRRRILHTLPSYPVQTDMELAIARLTDPKAQLLGTDLKPNRELKVWEPDFEAIEENLSNPELNIGVVSIIHPSNPTGHVWKPADLRKLCELANQYGAVIESDETYWQVVAGGTEYVSAGVIAAELGTPVVIYRSASKDALKCGDKFGWAEFYNFSEDPRLADIKKAYFNLQQEKVGATAIQRLVPLIYDHPEYPAWIADLNAKLSTTANVVAECFQDIDGVSCIAPEGAMYTAIVFDEGVLSGNEKMEIEDSSLRGFVEQKTAKPGMPLDERFLVYLMAKTGVVASPLSGFRGKSLGLRVCNFEFDPYKARVIYGKVADAVKEYLVSA